MAQTEDFYEEEIQRTLKHCGYSDSSMVDTSRLSMLKKLRQLIVKQPVKVRKLKPVVSYLSHISSAEEDSETEEATNFRTPLSNNVNISSSMEKKSDSDYRYVHETVRSNYSDSSIGLINNHNSPVMSSNRKCGLRYRGLNSLESSSFGKNTNVLISNNCSLKSDVGYVPTESVEFKRADVNPSLIYSQKDYDMSSAPRSKFPRFLKRQSINDYKLMPRSAERLRDIKLRQDKFDSYSNKAFKGIDCYTESSQRYNYQSSPVLYPSSDRSSLKRHQLSKPKLEHSPLFNQIYIFFVKIWTSINRLFNSIDSSAFWKEELPEVDHSETNGIIPLISTNTSETEEYRDNADEFHIKEPKAWISSHYQAVSRVLVIIVFLFFAILAIFYANLQTESQFDLIIKDNWFQECETTNEHKYCLNKSQVRPMIEFLKQLYPLMKYQTVKDYCEKSQNNGLLTLNEILKNLPDADEKQIKEDIRYLKMLVFHNPHWNIVIKDNNNPYLDFRNEEDFEILLETGGFLLLGVGNPLLCAIKFQILSALEVMFYIIIICIICGILLHGLNWYSKYVKQFRKQVYDMVGKVTELLANHHEMLRTSNSHEICSIPVNDVRDRLIGPHERKKMNAIWEAAKLIIEEHESQVLTELHTINGEERKVWCWQPVTKADKVKCPSPSEGRRQSKVWQGQAFETNAGSPNSLPCSPTPCLKIRHMFDPDVEYGEDWPIFIRDAILEKCEGVSVLHLVVDKTSHEGCVYMKCASKADAGKAYHALHGWWFGTSHLVTVKYLRLERYYMRFPEAADCQEPLRPSNNQRLSMRES